MDSDLDLNAVKNINTGPDLVNGPFYSASQRQLGELCYGQKKFMEAIYHLSESHDAGLRQVGALESVRSNPEANLSEDPLSFHSDYTKNGVEGVLNRLKEMPSEWTLVQLTRTFNPSEVWKIRKANTSPKLKDFFLSRLPCGKDLKKFVPLVVKLSWQDENIFDLIQAFLDVKEKLGIKKGSAVMIRKKRQETSSDLEKYCRDIGSLCLKEWTCLFLGKLYSKALEEEIRTIIDKRLEETIVTDRQRYFCYLLAEGCCHLENADLEVALYQVFEDNETLAVRVLEAMVRVKETFGSRLYVAKRHPVLLILDDHLDIIPWECLPFLRRHPVSRIYSVQFAHYLYRIHKDYIRDGLREIHNADVSFYIVNPDGDLPQIEEVIAKFLRKRFPSWTGIVGKKPSEEEMMQALTEANSYVYCGHGSGSQYLQGIRVQQLNVKPLQFLYGCSSVGLKDLGGLTEMFGDAMNYALAKSGCTVGMIYPVTTSDTDKITMVLSNICLPGTPVDLQTFQPLEKDEAKKEPELLRALRDVRESVSYFFNGAALVARGIPIKLV